MNYLLAAVVGLAACGSGYLASLLVADVASFMGNGSVLEPTAMELVGVIVVSTSCSVIIVMTAVLLGTACYLLRVATRNAPQSPSRPFLVIS